MKETRMTDEKVLEQAMSVLRTARDERHGVVWSDHARVLLAEMERLQKAARLWQMVMDLFPIAMREPTFNSEADCCECENVALGWTGARWVAWLSEGEWPFWDSESATNGTAKSAEDALLAMAAQVQEWLYVEAFDSGPMMCRHCGGGKGEPHAADCPGAVVDRYLPQGAS